jgi:hypothetical protein
LIGAHGTGASGPVVANSRKDAAQMILAEDFLSPAAAGLGRDVWAPWLELFIAQGPWVCTGAGLGKSALRGTSITAFGDRGCRPERARPSLLVACPRRMANGGPCCSSTAPRSRAGRRIITTTLHPSTDRPVFRQPSEGFEPIFGDAYDTYDLICYGASNSTANPCGCSVLGGPDLTNRIDPQRMSHCDIPLSAAVSNSTRFPVISPHGNIMGRDGTVVDRIVDWGVLRQFGPGDRAGACRAIARMPDSTLSFSSSATIPASIRRYAKRPADQMQVIRSQPKPPPPIEPKPFAMLQYPAFTAIATRVARSVQSTTEAEAKERGAVPGPKRPEDEPGSTSRSSSHPAPISSRSEPVAAATNSSSRSP